MNSVVFKNSLIFLLLRSTRIASKGNSFGVTEVVFGTACDRFFSGDLSR